MQFYPLEVLEDLARSGASAQGSASLSSKISAGNLFRGHRARPRARNFRPTSLRLLTRINRLPLDWPHDRRNSITGIALGFVIYWNHRILLDLVRDDVKGTVSRVRANSVPVEALAQFITGALFGLLMWWLNGKMRLSVEEVNTLFRQLAIPVLKGRDAAT